MKVKKYVFNISQNIATYMDVRHKLDRVSRETPKTFLRDAIFSIRLQIDASWVILAHQYSKKFTQKRGVLLSCNRWLQSLPNYSMS
jgi:predicted small secreted protein